MPVTIEPIHPIFAGRATGIDLTQPVSADDARAIEAGMDQYAVLVLPGQDITDVQQTAFSRHFGDLERPGPASNITRPDRRRLGIEIADISNLDHDNRVLERDDRQRMFNLGNRLWHSDSSFKAVPAKFSLLSARAVPAEGGETQFADMRAAYDDLNDRTKAKIEDLVCEHSLIYSRGQLGFDALTEDESGHFRPVRQRLVRRHPATGRKSLYLSAHAGTIVGWPTPEARLFLRELTEEATRPTFVYTHIWTQHDLVIWDNRRTMHRGRAFEDTEDVRDMRRTTVAGSAPTVEQVA